MDILQLIDRLEELFNDAKAVPFTHNVVVDEDRMLEIIDQMRIVIPDEVKKAQQVLAQRDRFLAQAQEEADRTIVLCQNEAELSRFRDYLTINVSSFFRDPEREIPTGAVAVSPADGKVVLDANHPLAGLSLVFDCEITEVRAPDGAAFAPLDAANR